MRKITFTTGGAVASDGRRVATGGALARVWLGDDEVPELPPAPYPYFDDGIEHMYRTLGVLKYGEIEFSMNEAPDLEVMAQFK